MGLVEWLCVCYPVGMVERRSGVHVVTTVRRYKDREYRAHLLRHSYREGGKVRKETVGNITVLGDELVAVVRAGLQGKQVGVIDELLPPVRSRPHGHVRAIVRAMERLGFARLLASRSSRERSIILALVAQRVLSPVSSPRGSGLSSPCSQLALRGHGSLPFSTRLLVTGLSPSDRRLALLGAVRLRRTGRGPPPGPPPRPPP